MSDSCELLIDMPADGDVLVALVVGCAEPGGDGAVVAKKLAAAADAYFSRVGTLRKTGKTGQVIFSAADAKKEGGSLVKIANTSLKQQASLKEGQEEVAKQLLCCAEKAVAALHDMQAHLTCSELDLEKMSLNLIQKLMERGMGSSARQQTQIMLVRLANFNAVSRSLNRKPATAVGEASKENTCIDNKKSVKDSGSTTLKSEKIAEWKDALAALTATPDACRNSTKDEGILVVNCLVNLGTFALQQPPVGFPRHPVLQMCGSGCLRWLNHLTVLDVASSQRLAGSLYRLTSKAAAIADGMPGDASDDVDAALQLRELSLVYLAASGKVGVAEIVGQLVSFALNLLAFLYKRTNTDAEGAARSRQPSSTTPNPLCALLHACQSFTTSFSSASRQCCYRYADTNIAACGR